MGVGNQVHASMKVYIKFTHVSRKGKITYFGWSGVRFGQVGGAGSAGPEVVAAAVAAVLDAAGPRAAVVAAVGLPAVAAEISVAAVAE